MEDELIDPGVDLTNGNGTPADYLQNTGGSASPIISNQNIFDTLDNGLLSSNAATITNTSTGVPVGTSGSSASGLPAWLTGIQGLATSAISTATTIAPLINGKPSTTAAAAGTPVNGVVTPLGTFSPMTVLVIIGAVLAFVFLGQRRRA